ncbi:MAG: serine/threonine-protein kinase [Candidatus Altimarinota bacterium]
MDPSKKPEESQQKETSLPAEDVLSRSNQTTKKAVKIEPRGYAANPDTRVDDFYEIGAKIEELEAGFREQILRCIDQTRLIETLGSEGLKNANTRTLLKYVAESVGIRIFLEWLPKWKNYAEQVAEYQRLSPELSEVLVDQFLLTGMIRDAESSTVYSAWDFREGKKVVIKVVTFQNEEAKNHFDLEVSALNGCYHPSIIQLLQAHRTEREGYIVMPFVEGGTLMDLISPEHPLPLFSNGEQKGAMEMMVHISEVIRYLHEELGLCHNDIKPANILRGKKGELFIADFGISHKENQSLFAQTPGKERGSDGPYIYGTPKYMAPEKIDGSPGTFATDVYSLGVTFYQLLTGVFPVEGRGIRELTVKKLRGEPAPIRQYRYDLPPALENLIMLMVHSDPQRRPGMSTVSSVLRKKMELWKNDPAVNHEMPVKEGPGTQHMKNMTRFRQELSSNSSRYRKNRP